MTITDEQVDQLGRLADNCDNCLHAAQLPLPASIHLEGLTGGLQKARDELRELHAELSREIDLGREMADQED